MTKRVRRLRLEGGYAETVRKVVAREKALRAMPPFYATSAETEICRQFYFKRKGIRPPDALWAYIRDAGFRDRAHFEMETQAYFRIHGEPDENESLP